jgi:5-oxoprolinase (ATP-hydrolysing)
VGNSNNHWNIRVDTGGTFTDCLGIDPEGKRYRTKVLSSSGMRGAIVEILSASEIKIEREWEAPDDFIKGFEFKLLDSDREPVAVKGFESGRSVITLDKPLAEDSWKGHPIEMVSPEESPVLAARLITQTPIGSPLPPINLRLATTRGTNALLERKGARTALFITEGFGDLLRIGTQQRPDLFALKIEKPEPLYEEVIEVKERLDAGGEVLTAIAEASFKSKAEKLIEKGIRSATVVFMNSYANPAYEQKMGQWLRDLGFEHISVSNDLSRFVKLLPRAQTTLVNAYLAPVMESYLDQVESAMSEGTLSVMTSAGGLKRRTDFTPKDGLLSGPAAGVVGASAVGKASGFSRIISFDMGGTSTDVSRYDEDMEYTFEHQVGDARLMAPAVAIETVAAGGGSVCSFDGHTLRVGPESAGADPGPACYGSGGPLSLTDVNILAGRLVEKNFHIPVESEAAKKKLQEVTADICKAEGKEIEASAVLEGFLDIANQRMAEAIEKISLRKGYDPADYALVSFGGAGGQHCCAIARRLGIIDIIIPKDAGLLSAYGLGHAVMEHFEEEQLIELLSDCSSEIGGRMDELSRKAREALSAKVPSDDIEVRRRLIFMRLKGQESTLKIAYEPEKDLQPAFQEAYRQQFGHWVQDAVIEIESLRVVVSTTSDGHSTPKKHSRSNQQAGASGEWAHIEEKEILFNGSMRAAPVYERSDAVAGASFEGPALVLDPYNTIVIEPGWKAEVLADGSLKLKANDLPVGESKSKADKHSDGASKLKEGGLPGVKQKKDGNKGNEGKSEEPGKSEKRQTEEKGRNLESKKSRPEAVELELFTHRFTSIAEKMGEMLQRTARSVNVKERQDFSCALLDPGGQLVVNAPHIPVHLGAMGICVRSLQKEIEMRPGDVIITNHPAHGGSHLPDVTVVSPIFNAGHQLIGYAANRAHHAEIGGSRPGSMPPDATSLVEEGVVIPPMYLLKEGEPQLNQIKDHLLNAAWPTRSIDENMADLQAQLAANRQGAEALRQLEEEHGLQTLHHYMDQIKNRAERLMRDTLKEIPDGVYEAEELLDDGTPLCAKWFIDNDSVRIDFEGTGAVHPYNLNANPAIVNSVVMYVLRLLVGRALPLNEGLMEPVTLKLPQCLLNPVFSDDPKECPAVVGGNIEISQRLTDTLLKPFERIACGQGTMNNVLFGNEAFGYYETVGGGSGAGTDFDGADAVHQHMTNTRGTDPEIFEQRYPVRLERYAIRSHSGGSGTRKGGDGIIREMTFLEPMKLSVLTQHRVQAPYGQKGGEPGKRGKQWVVRKGGEKVVLEPSDACEMNSGDRFVLHTPGGGGFGNE